MNVRVEVSLVEALRAVKARDGIPISEQIRRALRQWLEQRGVALEEAGRRRAATRRRP